MQTTMQTTQRYASLGKICPRLDRSVVHHVPLDDQSPASVSVLILSGHTEDQLSLPYHRESRSLPQALESLYQERMSQFVSYSMTEGLTVTALNGNRSDQRRSTSTRDAGHGSTSSSSSGNHFMDLARSAQREARDEVKALGRYQHEPHQALMEIHQTLLDQPRTLCLVRGVGDWEAISSERPDVVSALRSWPDLCISQGSLVIFADHRPSDRLCQFFQGLPHCQRATLSGPCEQELSHWLVTREIHDEINYDPTLSGELIAQLKRQSRVAQVGLKSLEISARAMLDEAWLAASGARAFDPKRVDVAGLEAWFGTSLIGQQRAKSAVLKATKNMKYFGTEGRRGPLIRGLFTGPPGVGKTEIARGLSRFLYQQDEPLLINCTEYQQEHEVAKLLGAPPGYVGYGTPSVIERFITERTAGVIIFDEFEKAHQRVHQALMGALEEGILQTPTGSVIELDRSVIIGTTNAGHNEVRRALQMNPELSRDHIEALYESGVEERFDAPLLRRFDVKVTFDFLNNQELAQVAELYLRRSVERFTPDGVTVQWTDAFLKELVDRADPTLGAGELKNTVEDAFKGALIDLYYEQEIRPSQVMLTASGEDVHAESRHV